MAHACFFLELHLDFCVKKRRLEVPNIYVEHRCYFCSLHHYLVTGLGSNNVSDTDMERIFPEFRSNYPTKLQSLAEYVKEKQARMQSRTSFYALDEEGIGGRPWTAKSFRSQSRGTGRKDMQSEAGRKESRPSSSASARTRSDTPSLGDFTRDLKTTFLTTSYGTEPNITRTLALKQELEVTQEMREADRVRSAECNPFLPDLIHVSRRSCCRQTDLDLTGEIYVEDIEELEDRVEGLSHIHTIRAGKACLSNKAVELLGEVGFKDALLFVCFPTLCLWNRRDDRGASSSND